MADQKKVLIVVPPVEFDDDAYELTRRILESAGNRVAVASMAASPAIGVAGSSAPASIAIRDVKTWEWDAYVFVGGPGARILFDDERTRKFVKDVEYKVIGAVGNASFLLALSGALKGKQATGDAEFGARMVGEGAVYTGREVEVDGKIVTTRDATYSELFANALLGVLNK